MFIVDHKSVITISTREVCFFFFFKQKTAYEMRISDWSSDVCSSDLQHQRRERKTVLPLPEPVIDENIQRAVRSHMMPPHRRHIDRIAGGEIGDEFIDRKSVV